MSQEQEFAGWHGLLSAMSGRLPDEVLEQAWAAGDNGTRLEILAAGAAQAGSSITANEIEALVRLVEPGDAESTSRVLNERGDLSLQSYRFSPLDPSADGTAWNWLAEPDEPLSFGPVPLDLSVGDPAGWADPDAVAALSVASSELGVLGLWGAWRELLQASGPGERVRVFMFEVGEETSAADATVRLRSALPQVAGIRSGIEVFGVGARLSDYQRSVLGSGALLWTARPEAVPEVVPVFDAVDPEAGPRFDGDHERLTADERAVVAAYLYGADAVMYTTETMLDVVDPGRGEVVPLSFRCDGEYIWPEAVAYYVDQHGLAPYSPLLAAIRLADYQPRRPDVVTLFRAENALFATE